MAVVQVSVYRPLPGRFPEFLARVAEAKKISERLGARSRVVGTQFGARPQTVTLVVEYDDLAQFAKVGTKLQSDQAFQALMAKVQTDPAGELLDQSLGQDIDLP